MTLSTYPGPFPSRYATPIPPAPFRRRACHNSPLPPHTQPSAPRLLTTFSSPTRHATHSRTDRPPHVPRSNPPAPRLGTSLLASTRFDSPPLTSHPSKGADAHLDQARIPIETLHIIACSLGLRHKRGSRPRPRGNAPSSRVVSLRLPTAPGPRPHPPRNCPRSGRYPSLGLTGDGRLAIRSGRSPRRTRSQVRRAGASH